MSEFTKWLIDAGAGIAPPAIDGLIVVENYNRSGAAPEEVAILEKAAEFGAVAVFFEAKRHERSASPQAFIFVSKGPEDDDAFAEIHRRLWSWGGVPLLYRRTPGQLQLFRCAHRPDFVSRDGAPICKPFKTLKTAAAIADDAWWDAERLRNGTLWDDPAIAKAFLSASKAAHKRLIDAVRRLNDDLNKEGVLRKHLRRKLLILCLLIAYLEERGAFPDGYFAQFSRGATKFFEVLPDGRALVRLLKNLEGRFNGHVFVLEPGDADALIDNRQLARFARMVEGREEENGQLTLWQLYSFKDLPIEVISHIYQLFVQDSTTAVYTPPFLVRLMLDEAMSWSRIDDLHAKNQIILDPCCGSGIFLVEAYKKLVLHWRSRNQWKRPGKQVLTALLEKVHGIDLEDGAVELAAFSLCLALCDGLEKDAIRASIKLFPVLAGKTLHKSCFFEAKEKRLIKEPIGLVVGNPPFASSLGTPGAERSYTAFERAHGSLPDKQLGYLVLHEAMGMVSPGGCLSMLQQYNFLYNQGSLKFRQQFLRDWDVREVLDFISVRGLFHKGGADTKVIVVLAQADEPPADRKILHATFRRSGRSDAEQGFDIDYYDFHWVPRNAALVNDGIWRANLLGGARVAAFVTRLKEYRSLGTYATEQGWDFGEGYIEGRADISKEADHIVGKPLLPSEALTVSGIDPSKITRASDRAIEGPRSRRRFTPPLLLVREQMDLPNDLWTKGYLTYKNQIVGFAAPKDHADRLRAVRNWLVEQAIPLRAFVAASSLRLFTQKATTLGETDVVTIPFPESRTLELSDNERIIADDIVNYQRDLIRLGEDSTAMGPCNAGALASYSQVLSKQINSIYKARPIKPLPPQTWQGLTCQPFVFGDGAVDWSGADQLKGRLNTLLQDKQGSNLKITRIAKIYDQNFMFFLKPDRLRFWLRSIALQDADETLTELRRQGF